MLLSIIIPSRNRQVILETTCKSLLNLINEDIELIICDNSDKISEYLGSLQVVNFRYIFDSYPKTIGENFSNAIDFANGKYCVFLGDDDLVSLNLFNIVSKLDSQVEFDALLYNKSRFFWPGVKSDSFQFEHFHSNFKREIAFTSLSIESIRKAAEDKGFMSIFLLPTPYHNIIKLSILKKIKIDFGSIVLGISPDISMGYLVSYYVESVFFVNRSLTLYGGSTLSGAGLSVKKKHHMPINEVDFFKVDRSDWNEKLPFYWSESITFPQSIYMVCKNTNKVFNFNINYFYSYAFLKEPYLWRRFLPFLIYVNSLKFIWYFFILGSKSLVWTLSKSYFVKIFDCKDIDSILLIEYESSSDI
jgi:glycosyltransferase involved in cell wall biosynthesis